MADENWKKIFPCSIVCSTHTSNKENIVPSCQAAPLHKNSRGKIGKRRSNMFIKGFL